MNELEIVVVMAATIFGAIFSAWFGWMESGEPFDDRKFLASVWRGVMKALLDFVALSTVLREIPLTVVTLVSAFLMGAGFEILLKRGQEALIKKSGGTPA